MDLNSYYLHTKPIKHKCMEIQILWRQAMRHLHVHLIQHAHPSTNPPQQPSSLHASKIVLNQTIIPTNHIKQHTNYFQPLTSITSTIYQLFDPPDPPPAQNAINPPSSVTFEPTNPPLSINTSPYHDLQLLELVTSTLLQHNIKPNPPPTTTTSSFKNPYIVSPTTLLENISTGNTKQNPEASKKKKSKKKKKKIT